MKASLHDYIKPGVIHFMAYPATAGGDAVHAHAVETLFDEHFLGRFQDRGTLAQVLGAAGTGAARSRLAGGWGRMMRGHSTILDQLVRYLYYTAKSIN